jgi:thioredoxin reductase (NADPH)
MLWILSLFAIGVPLVMSLDVEMPLQKEYRNFFESVVMPSHARVHGMDPEQEQVVVSSHNASRLDRCDIFDARLKNSDHKLLILGGGPAGLTAAIYAARAELEPIVVAADGGQLESTSTIDNFPGFENGVDAVEMVQRMEKQAARFGASFKSCQVTDVDLRCRPFKVTCGSGGTVLTSAIIVATGARAKWIGAPGETELLSRGVHTCATCDGYFYKGKRVVVVGGGDSAMEQALFLARLSERVTLVHRRSSFKASKAMIARVTRHPQIDVLWDTVLDQFNSKNGDRLSSVKLRNVVSQATFDLDVDGAFVAIGHTPNTQLFVKNGVNVDENGYIVTIPGTSRTSVTGVYAAGDVQDAVYRQAITSAGTGAMAAIDAERWLCQHGC